MRWSGGAWQPLLPPPGALVELAVLLAAIAVVDAALPGVDVANLEPSPYWIPVLLLSLQYGTVAGLLAAGAATVAFVLYGFPEQTIGENLFTYLLRIWALPMLWIGVALVLGQFRLRQIAAKREVKEGLAQKTAEASSLAWYARELEDRCQKLERHISTGRVTRRPTALDALAHLIGPSADLGAALAGVVEDSLPGAAISIFAATPAGLEMVQSSGWPELAPWATELPVSHPVHRALVGERKALFVLNTGDEALLAGQGLAACPIVAPDNGRVVGIVKLETADPANLSRNTPARLAVIARLVAPALTEPRVVVDNDPRHGRAGESLTSRLTRGWHQQTWRAAADDARTDTMSNSSEAADANATVDRPTRPKRLV